MPPATATALSTVERTSRRRTAANVARTRAIQAAWAAGASAGQIAAHAGVTRSRAFQIATEAARPRR
jgi:hypothetical protein